jgi:hypothetical protein
MLLCLTRRISKWLPLEVTDVTLSYANDIKMTAIRSDRCYFVLSEGYQNRVLKMGKWWNLWRGYQWNSHHKTFYLCSIPISWQRIITCVNIFQHSIFLRRSIKGTQSNEFQFLFTYQVWSLVLAFLRLVCTWQAESWSVCVFSIIRYVTYPSFRAVETQCQWPGKHLASAVVSNGMKAVRQTASYISLNYNRQDAKFSRSIDMDMSYTRVLHIKVAYRVPHKWRHAFYVTRLLLCARITCYVTVIKHGRCCARA